MAYTGTRQGWHFGGRLPLVVVMMALIATLMPAPPADAATIGPHAGSGGTQWQISYDNFPGSNASCGPQLGGDGWTCQGHTANRVRYGMRAEGPSGSQFATLAVWLGVTAGSGGGDSNINNTCGFGRGCTAQDKDFTFLEAKTLNVSGDYSYKLFGSCCFESYFTSSYPIGSFNAIKTVSQIVNLPPEVTNVGPAGSFSRATAAEHQQILSMRATDPEGHRWTGELEITSPGGTVLNETFAGNPNTSGSTAQSLPRELPHENGTYTWRARATDTSGTSTSVGPWLTGSFNYTWNTAPSVPTVLVPASGAQFPEGTSVAVAIQATDPEGDHYRGLVELRHCGSSTIGQFDTTPSVSGGVSTAVLGVPGAGCYEWSAVAVDQHGWFSPRTAWQPFTVSPTVSNSAPATPSLVSPLAGATFADGQAQVFTIATTDPDGDDYVGRIEVLSSGVPVTTFSTDQAASGQQASGQPPAPLPAGSYTWRATAVDLRGGVSGTSASRSFIVAGPGNAAPSTPTLVSPADNRTWRFSDLQQFTIRSTDPDGDPYSGVITVTNTATGAAREFETALTASGQNSSGVPVPPLDPGSYTWVAHAVDAHGASSGASVSRTLTVLANRAPGAPAHVSPEDGHAFGPTEPQLFAVRSSDPDGDAYSAEIQVRQGFTTRARFETGLTPSGMDAYGMPVMPLQAGTYTWRARAKDVHGAWSGWSSDRTVTVAGPDSYPSDDCDGGETVADGFAGGSYVKLRADQPDPSSAAVCVRVDGNSGLRNGGKLVVSQPGASAPPTPVVDGDWESCSTTPGNNSPLPSPLVDGEVGDPSDPTTHVAQHLDVYVSDEEVWLCTRVASAGGTHARRVKVFLPDGVTPATVAWLPDAPGRHVPLATPWPTGLPSETCSNPTFGILDTQMNHVNASAGPSHVWLSSRTEGVSRAYVCVRAQGLASVGGVLTFELGGSPGVSPVITTSSADMSPCTLQVIGFTSPAELQVRRSATGADPASVCVNVEGSWLRVTAGPSDPSDPVLVTWTPDPGTPG